MRTLLGALSLFLSLCSLAAAGEVRLSVATSLTDATRELVAAYQKRDGQVALFPNFASSGALARQIEQGAPADIFISANPKWMHFLVEEQFIPPDRVATLALNALVFVGNRALAVTSLDDVARLRRIAIGSPKSVPAGQYAEQALKTAGLYEQVRGKLVMARDVRQALMYADRGETDGAFVYRTDALLARDAVILLGIPQSLYDRVTYLVGLTSEGLGNPAAVAFLDFLKSDEATGILQEYGFIIE